MCPLKRGNSTLAYLQLWVAREAATCLPGPWERHLVLNKAGKSTPTLVQRDFEGHIPHYGTPAKAPKPQGKSPGGKQGFRLPTRQGHKVLKKGANPPP